MRADRSGPRKNWRRIALAGDAGPHFLEAGTTVDGPVQPGNEGHNSLAAAHGTDDGGHFSAVVRCPLPPAGRPTGGTTLRFVEQALLQVEALLPSSEDEFHSTIAASYGLVFQSQFRRPPWQVYSRSSSRSAGRESGPRRRPTRAFVGEWPGRSRRPRHPEGDSTDWPAGEGAFKSQPGHGGKYRPALRQRSRQ